MDVTLPTDLLSREMVHSNAILRCCMFPVIPTVNGLSPQYVDSVCTSSGTSGLILYARQIALGLSLNAHIGHHEWSGASPVEVSPKQSHNLLSLDSSPPLPSSAATRDSDDSATVASPQSLPLQEGGPQEATVDTPPLASVSFAAALRCPNKTAPPPMWPGRESAKKKVSTPIGELEKIQGHLHFHLL